MIFFATATAISSSGREIDALSVAPLLAAAIGNGR